MELGNHAEFLGVMSYTDMLATFFARRRRDTEVAAEGHAENDFWRWMASWAVMMLRKPSDLGATATTAMTCRRATSPHARHSSRTGRRQGCYFALQAETLAERLTASRETIGERVAKAVEMTPTDEPVV